jgi:hypothetical protein
MKNQNLRQRIEQLFGLPAMKMPWTLYLAQLNEAGKLTARSTMDILTVVLTSLEELEEKVKSDELTYISATPIPSSTPLVDVPSQAQNTTPPPPKVEEKPQDLPQELKV